VAALTIYLAAGSTTGRPPKAVADTLPDQFTALGAWALSADETLRMVHVPDSPTGLRCLIYSNAKTKQSSLYCDDDLPRGLRPQPTN
jgi:hypothetical protein